MDLTVKNIEKFFNILSISSMGVMNLFDLLLIVELKEDDILQFSKPDEEFFRVLKLDKVLAEKYGLYLMICDSYNFLSDYYLKKFRLKIEPTQFKEITNEIKKIYKKVNYINSALDKIAHDIKNKKLRNNDEARERDVEHLSEIAAYNKQIEDDRTHYLNYVIELGMCKSAVKKHLCLDPEKLLLKDLFTRYFVLKCNKLI